MNLDDLVAFGSVIAVLITPVVLVAAIIHVYVRTLSSEKRRRSELSAFANLGGYSYQVRGEAVMLKGSYPSGEARHVISGELPLAKNTFRIFDQIERRGKFDQEVYMRTTAQINIPETHLQVLINSKLNDARQSSENLNRYSDNQIYVTEGDFSRYFTLMAPKTTENEVLTMLSPEVLFFIEDNLSKFDIEIFENELYLYSYKHLRPKTIEQLIVLIDTLVEELKLRPSDTRQHKSSTKGVSRTAVHSESTRRLQISTLKIVLALAPAGMVYACSYFFKISNSPFAYYVTIAVVILSIAAPLKIFPKLARQKMLDRSYSQRRRG